MRSWPTSTDLKRQARQNTILAGSLGLILGLAIFARSYYVNNIESACAGLIKAEYSSTFHEKLIQIGNGEYPISRSPGIHSIFDSSIYVSPKDLEDNNTIDNAVGILGCPSIK